MKNSVKYYIYSALIGLGNMFCVGTIVQTFLLQSGFSDGQVYNYNAVIQGVQAVVMLGMLFLSDKIKKPKLVCGVCILSNALLSIVLVIVALGLNGVTAVIAVFSSTVTVYLFMGINNVIAYCLPYRVFDMKNYGSITGISVAVSGIINFAVSFLYTYSVTAFDYKTVMTVWFIVATLCFIFASVTCLSMREVSEQTEISESQSQGFVALFKNKTTYYLLIPNFFRGLAMGVISVLTVIGFSMSVLTVQTASLMNILIQIATFSANVIFALLVKKTKSAILTLISSTGVALLLPTILLVLSPAWFLSVYTLVYFFLMAFSSGVPVMLPEIIPEKQIGAFTSLRMMLFTAGQMLASVMTGLIINSLGEIALLIIASVLQLTSGIIYYIVWKTVNKNGENLSTNIETVK